MTFNRPLVELVFGNFFGLSNAFGALEHGGRRKTVGRKLRGIKSAVDAVDVRLIMTGIIFVIDSQRLERRAFDAAGDDALGEIRADFGEGDSDGGGARGALHIDGERRNVELGKQRSQAGDIAAGADGVAQNYLINRFRAEAPQQSGAEHFGANRFKFSVGGDDRRPTRVDHKNFSHGVLPPLSKISPARRLTQDTVIKRRRWRGVGNHDHRWAPRSRGGSAGGAP